MSRSAKKVGNTSLKPQQMGRKPCLPGLVHAGHAPEAEECETLGREIGRAHTQGQCEERTRQVVLLKRIGVGLRTFGKRKAGTY